MRLARGRCAHVVACSWGNDRDHERDRDDASKHRSAADHDTTALPGACEARSQGRERDVGVAGWRRGVAQAPPELVIKRLKSKVVGHGVPSRSRR
jgi:hypothetical protein